MDLRQPPACALPPPARRRLAPPVAISSRRAVQSQLQASRFQPSSLMGTPRTIQLVAAIASSAPPRRPRCCVAAAALLLGTRYMRQGHSDSAFGLWHTTAAIQRMQRHTWKYGWDGINRHKQALYAARQKAEHHPDMNRQGNRHGKEAKRNACAKSARKKRRRCTAPTRTRTK